MDFKKEMDEHCGETEEKAKELHQHTFSWRFGTEDLYNVGCKKAGSIYESLQNSAAFEKKAAENQGKELVILTQRKAISSYFPCHKMNELHIDTLTIMYISAGRNQTTATSSEDKKNHGELIIFCMRTTGGISIVHKVMTNDGLRKIVDEVIVCGYKGQTVRDALEQDGRFRDEVLQDDCFLEDIKDGKRTEMSSPVDILNGCFKITIAKSRKSLGAAKQDAPKEETSSKTASSNIPTPHQNVSNQPTPHPEPHTPQPSHRPTPYNRKPQSTYQPIPNSKDLLKLLRSQFKDLVKVMIERQNLAPQAVKKHLSQEFGKSTEFCHEVRTMRRFLELGDSVCQVRIDDTPKGSGFLLFGKYILTNAHVVSDVGKKNLTVIFSYEKLSDSQSMGARVVDSCFGPDAAGHKHDWALLEVSGDLKNGPIKPLLEHFGLVTERGQICIIGHPGGEVKKIDPCFTIPPSERLQKMMFLTSKYIYPDPMDKNIHTYESCFAFGSSGSPVFDINFNVVSMHSGGFPDKKGGHLLEYSHPLSFIIEEIIIQILGSKNVDMLLAINCGIPPMVEDVVKTILSNDEGLVWTEEEIITLCEGDQACTKTKLLKDFFRLYSQRDEPMDTNS